jgi:hypothetical protein
MSFTPASGGRKFLAVGSSTGIYVALRGDESLYLFSLTRATELIPIHRVHESAELRECHFYGRSPRGREQDVQQVHHPPRIFVGLILAGPHGESRHEPKRREGAAGVDGESHRP